jgi:hypothetical protein
MLSAGFEPTIPVSALGRPKPYTSRLLGSASEQLVLKVKQFLYRPGQALKEVEVPIFQGSRYMNVVRLSDLLIGHKSKLY